MVREDLPCRGDQVWLRIWNMKLRAKSDDAVVAMVLLPRSAGVTEYWNFLKLYSSVIRKRLLAASFK